MAAESHREFVSPRAELQNSTRFRSASQQDGGMIGYKKSDTKKERQKCEEVRDDTYTRM